MYDHDWAPEGIPAFAKEVEELGADDLWVVEDLGWYGGISAAAVALAATRRLRVGIGIAPAPLRNAALLAMEVATLERVFPGRLVAGIGHGVPEWMTSVGAMPRSPLALLEETIESVRALLSGERVELTGREVRLDGIRLVHPPAEVPPLVAGVVREKSLQLSGRVADGTLIAEGHGPEDLKKLRESIERGGPKAGHELSLLAFCCVGEDPEEVARILRPHVEGHAEWLGRPAEQVFTVSGTPREAAARIRELGAAGAATVALRVFGPEPLRQIDTVIAALAETAAS